MRPFQNILLSTDTRYPQDAAVDHAARIAKINGATLSIVDVVPEFSWAARLSLKDHKHMRELIQEEKDEQLESIAARVREMGVPVQTSLFVGKTSMEVIREAIRNDHDLVIRAAKGIGSRNRAFFGTTGVRLLRKCPCPVLLIAPDAPAVFRKVVGCVDTSSGQKLDDELNDQVFELASAISQYEAGGQYSIIHAWSIWNEGMLRSRMTADDFEEVAVSNRDHTAEMLDTFLKRHGLNAEAENVHMLQGEPSAAIPNYAKQSEADLIVMGTVARSGLSGFIMGNTAEQILSQLECSVLAIKPSSFVSPIRCEEPEPS